MRHIRVAVPVPQLEALTYAVPDGIPLPVIGARVARAARPATVTGVVIGHAEQAPAGVVAKEIVEVLDDEPFLPGGRHRAGAVGGRVLRLRRRRGDRRGDAAAGPGGRAGRRRFARCASLT